MSHSAMPSPYPMPGEIIGESWRVEKILGEGGMGAVARAWDLILHTPVAIKFMNPQYLTFPGAEERFINEGKASALIKSDHVVPVMKAGKTISGTPYLVMECLEGVDLADLITRDGTPGLPIERAVHFVLQVLRALQAAHAIGIIHRDMKPSNCFAVNKDGEEDFVKILDFGISKIQNPGSASLTQTNSALGTPLYMSPEQARSPRDVDARSDLYSVGVILYELLTGHTPFSSESGEFTEILFKLFTAEPPPVKSTRPDLPDDLAATVHKALARDVNERFPHALAMAEALAPYATERSRHVLTRMRAFRVPAKASVAPPEDLPLSMVAFSQLQHGPQTDLMSNRPTTDIMHGPPVTAMLPNAPGNAYGLAPPQLVVTPSPGPVPAFASPGVTGSSGESSRMAAVPQAVEARARPDEAQARTQLDSSPGALKQRAFVAGAQTDLSTARDTSAIDTGKLAPKGRSPLPFVLLAVAVLAIGGGAAALVASKGPKVVATADPPPPTMTITATSEPTSITSNGASNITLPPVIPSAETSAKSGIASASASASASALANGTKPPKPTPLGKNAGQPPPPGGGTSVLDTKIHE